MSKQLLITDFAKKDIADIFEYISNDNVKAANYLIDNFYKTFELILNYPECGSIKSSLRTKNIRVYNIKKKYAIIYRCQDSKIEILRILARYQNIFALIE